MKPKTPQPKTPGTQQERDLFQTPAYAVDLLSPYLPPFSEVWEPAAGLGLLAWRLRQHGHSVIETDLFPASGQANMARDFLSWETPLPYDSVITNPPFSLKAEFYARARALDRPFALLLPADLNQWLLRVVFEDGCRLIIPDRRIDFITPNVLQRVHEGETLRALNRALKGTGAATLKNRADVFPEVWEEYATALYPRLEDVPPALLRRYSASQFHSAWLTRGLPVPARFHRAPLSNESKGVILPCLD